MGTRKLGRTTDHRLSMLRSLTTSLLLHGKIETTEAKAKEVRSLVEKLITLGIKEQSNFTTAEKKVSYAKVDAEGKKVTEEVTSKNGKKYNKVVREITTKTVEIDMPSRLLMLLEKCAIREIYRHKKPDAVCREICGRHSAVLRDRMGKEFPVLREEGSDGGQHRNLVCNSLPTGMSDRPDELARLGAGQHHFIFTVESPAEVDRVIAAYREGRSLGTEVRRLPK